MDYLNRISPADCIVHQLLERRARAAPDAVFFTFEGEDVTTSHCNRMAEVVAGHLRAAGVGPGTHVAVLMDSTPEYLYLWFALSKLGAVEIPINTAYRGDLLRHVLQTCQATACVIESRFVDTLNEAAQGLAAFGPCIVRGGDAPPPPGAIRFETLLAPHGGDDLSVPAARADDITCVIFTSGTTGPSKGVLLSQHYLTAYGLMYAEINGLRDDDVVMNFLPYFHIAAKFLTIAVLACEGRMLLQRRLSISTFWQEVRAHGVTNFLGVGGICNMLISKPESPDDRDNTIRTIYAVPDPADVHDELERRFQCRITTVFGSTEAGLPLFRGVADPYRPTSCGRPSPYYEVQIVDDDDHPVPVGVSGEIVVRPRRPLLLGSGYIGMAERTVKAWRNLWLHTGDRGHTDADGFFYFDDRLSDSIRRRGENISSYEVEAIVTKHPAVSEAVAVATASDVGEDEVRVLVIPRQGQTLHPEDLLRHCCLHMPYFMVPRYIDVVQELPRTATAKVEKYKIRATGCTASTWDRDAHGWKVTRSGLQTHDGTVVMRFESVAVAIA